MKKASFCFLVIALLTLSQPPASAAGSTAGSVCALDIGGTEMSVTMPNGWILITKETPPDDPVFANNGIDGANFKTQLESQGIKAYAVNLETSNAIAVAYEIDPSYAEEPNLSALPDSQIDGIVEKMRKSASDEGCTSLTRKEIANMKFIYSEFGAPLNTIQYWTTVNGYTVIIALQNPDGNALNETDQGVFSNVIQSVSLGGAPAASPTAASQEAVETLADEISVSSVAGRICTLNVGSKEKMQVTMPKGWDILTPYIEPTDPLYGKYKLSGEFLNIMKSQNIYVDVFDPNTQNEIYIIINADFHGSQFPNMSAVSDDVVEKYIDQAVIKSEGETMIRKNVGNMKYIYSEYGTPLTAIQYWTTINGYSVIISLKGDSLGAQDQTLLESVVQSVSFGDVPASSSKSETAYSGPAATPERPAVSTMAILMTGGVGAAALLIFLMLRGRRKSAQQAATMPSKYIIIILRVLSCAFYIFGGFIMFSVGAAIGAGDDLSIYAGKMYLGLFLISIGAILMAVAKKISKRP